MKSKGFPLLLLVVLSMPLAGCVDSQEGKGNQREQSKNVFKSNRQPIDPNNPQARN